ncbi:hypothetical protein B0H16DRAFT_1463320 [Mycena metata]|uniref:Uncharacterized protein n=1 Tax=Mycena metata TaxID=1033252 RepID=A0AAD7IIQ9_9AGAR|nr:hypothetical protein B0H16DRAFT_1463320 [Mycena metata]
MAAVRGASTGAASIDSSYVKVRPRKSKKRNTAYIRVDNDAPLGRAALLTGGLVCRVLLRTDEMKKKGKRQRFRTSFAADVYDLKDEEERKSGSQEVSVLDGLLGDAKGNLPAVSIKCNDFYVAQRTGTTDRRRLVQPWDSRPMSAQDVQRGGTRVIIEEEDKASVPILVGLFVVGSIDLARSSIKLHYKPRFPGRMQRQVAPKVLGRAEKHNNPADVQGQSGDEVAQKRQEHSALCRSFELVGEKIGVAVLAGRAPNAGKGEKKIHAHEIRVFLGLRKRENFPGKPSSGKALQPYYDAYFLDGEEKKKNSEQ